jgi:hypothetical protein
MWMKTRVGFTALSEPLEIRTFKSRKSGNLCDLSHVGSADAWGGEWPEWPQVTWS